MTTEVQSEYRNLPLESLSESGMNPRRNFDEAALNELAASASATRSQPCRSTGQRPC